MGGGQLTAYRLLSATTTGCGCASFLCLFISVTTDHWLHTMEKNETTQAVGDYFYSGLWKKCSRPRAGSDGYSTCTYISYFGNVERDGIGPTDSILLSLRRAVVFPLASLLILFVGQGLCILTQWRRYRPAITIIFGFLYVLGGLCMFIGIIIYIGAITEEAGNRPKSMDDPTFLYWYGPSFALTFTSFVASELTGVLAVHLYVARRRVHASCKRAAAIAAAAAATGYDVTDDSPDTIDRLSTKDGGGEQELAQTGRTAIFPGVGLLQKLTGSRSGGAGGNSGGTSGLASRLLAVVAVNGSPKKVVSTTANKPRNELQTTEVVGGTRQSNQLLQIPASMTSASAGGAYSTGGGSRKYKGRRRRSSVAVALDRKLIQEAELCVGCSDERATFYDDDDQLTVCRSRLGSITPRSSYCEPERPQPPMQFQQHLGRSSRNNDGRVSRNEIFSPSSSHGNCHDNRYGDGYGGKTDGDVGTKFTSQNGTRSDVATSALPTVPLIYSKSTTNSPGAVSAGSSYGGADEYYGGRVSPVSAGANSTIGTRSLINYAMTSLPAAGPRGVSDYRLPMSVGVSAASSNRGAVEGGVVSRAWSIAALDPCLRRITHV